MLVPILTHLRIATSPDAANIIAIIITAARQHINRAITPAVTSNGDVAIS